MEIAINNNPHFAVFLCDRLMHRHNIETTAFLNVETQHTVIINRYEKDDAFIKKMYNHLLHMNRRRSRNDRSGFKVLVKIFRRQRAARLS